MKRAMEQQHHLPQPHGGSNSAAAPDNTVAMGTVKVPVKLYVGHHHRSLIDDSLQHAQGMQAYLTPTAAATNADTTSAASIENSNKHKPQSLHELLESVSDSTATGAAVTASTTMSRYLEDERPIRGAAVPMQTILERLHEEDVDAIETTTSTTHTMAASSKRKSLRTSRAPAVASSTHVAPTATAAVPLSSSSAAAVHGQGHAERKRQHEGCYVQLDVLSGDKLIPARKVSDCSPQQCPPVPPCSNRLVRLGSLTMSVAICLFFCTGRRDEGFCTRPQAEFESDVVLTDADDNDNDDDRCGRVWPIDGGGGTVVVLVVSVAETSRSRCPRLRRADVPPRVERVVCVGIAVTTSVATAVIRPRERRRRWRRGIDARIVVYHHVDTRVVADGGR